MSTVESIEQQIKVLSAEEVAKLREWFLEFDWVLWDQQLERDVAAGKLDVLADKALRDQRGRKDDSSLNHHASPDFWVCYCYSIIKEREEKCSNPSAHHELQRPC